MAFVDGTAHTNEFARTHARCAGLGQYLNE